MSLKFKMQDGGRPPKRNIEDEKLDTFIKRLQFNEAEGFNNFPGISNVREIGENLRQLRTKHTPAEGLPTFDPVSREEVFRNMIQQEPKLQKFFVDWYNKGFDASNLNTFADGGKVVGPSHNEGGIEAVDREGVAVAEIEGDERIFSVDDTKEIETIANEINASLNNDNQDIADQTAMILGHRIVAMIAKQERINPS